MLPIRRVAPAVTPASLMAFTASATFLLFLAFLLLSTPAHADERAPDGPGSISGTVTNEAGSPLPGIQVYALFQDSYYGYYRTTVSGSDGTYTLGLLGAGLYQVQFIDPSGIYVGEYYHDTQDRQAAESLSVVGNAVTGVDGTLAWGGRITGTVSATAGLSLTYAYVELWDPGDSSFYGPVTSVYLASGDSAYTLPSISPGQYVVCASGELYLDATASYSYFRECYDDEVDYDRSKAQLVSVQAGQTTANINFVLGESKHYASLRGRVTDDDGVPLSGIRVSALSAYVATHAAEALRPEQFAPEATTDENGQYTLTTLISGTYVIQAWDPSPNGIYLFTYYGDVATYQDATRVPLGAGAQIDSIDIQMAQAGRIQGKITFADDIASDYGSVEVYSYDDVNQFWYYVTGASVTPATGLYTVTQLLSGTYRLRATAEIAGYYVSQVYGGGDAIENGQDIIVGPGQSVTGIDLEMEAALFDGEIAGIVTSTGTPLAGIRVNIYSYAYYYAEPLAYTTTDADGRYIIGGLSPGFYYLGFTDPQNVYAYTYYPSSTRLDTAQSIFLTIDELTAQIDMAMERGGIISGRVATATGRGMPDYRVNLFAFDGFYWQYISESDGIVTNQDGQYTISGLPAGTYRICYYPLDYSYYTCYGDVSYVEGAADVVVVSGQTTANVDAVVFDPTGLAEVDEPAVPAFTMRVFLPAIQRE